MTRLRPLIFLAGLLLPLAACARPDVPKGVWEGTLGTKAIVACFNSGSPSGSYFYKQYKAPIPLTQGDGDSFWREANDTGRWSLDAAKGSTLTGVWRNVKGQPVALPIQLHLADASGGDAACGGEGYAGQLEAPPKIEMGKWKVYAPGRSSRTVRFAGQETLELSGPEPATARVNKQLRAALDMRRETVKEYFDKRREFLGRVGVPAEDENTAEPTYWTSQWVSVRFYNWAAGMGRSGISWEFRTWDLQSGEQVDLWSWFGNRRTGKAGEPAVGSSSGRLPPKLRRFLFQRDQIDPAKAESGCEDNYAETASFELTLEPTGVQISQPEYGRGCELAFSVPYTELAPVLTPAGKAAVQRILSSPPR